MCLCVRAGSSFNLETLTWQVGNTCNDQNYGSINSNSNSNNKHKHKHTFKHKHTYKHKHDQNDNSSSNSNSNNNNDNNNNNNNNNFAISSSAAQVIQMAASHREHTARFQTWQSQQQASVILEAMSEQSQ